MPDDISGGRRGRRSMVDRGLTAVAGLVLSSGGDPNSARSVLPGMAMMTATFQALFIVLPVLLGLEFGWEPKRWHFVAVAVLAVASFAPIVVGFVLLAWSWRRRRRRQPQGR